MDLWEFSMLIWRGSFLAGFIGALTGLGGGVVIITITHSGFWARYQVRDRGFSSMCYRDVFSIRDCPLLLIATPVAHVAFSVFAFVLQSGSTYVVVTLVVLTVLFYSILRGDF